MDIKVFCKPSIKEDEWEVYVTDDDFDTYSMKVISKEPPSTQEMEKYWSLKRQDFQLHSYSH